MFTYISIYTYIKILIFPNENRKLLYYTSIINYHLTWHPCGSVAGGQPDVL